MLSSWAVRLARELNIQVLPFPIAMEDREYADGFDFTPEEFYDMLLAASKTPTHAQLFFRCWAHFHFSNSA